MSTQSASGAAEPGAVPAAALPGWLAPLAGAAAAVDPAGPWLGWRPRARTVSGTPRRSAVLILFGSGEHGPDVLITERAATLRSHAGQPSFPGGGIDPGDSGPVGAALREAREEVGVDPAGVSVFGTLPELYLQPSDFMVTSVLGWWREPAPLRVASPVEVAAVHRVPVSELVDPANRLRVRHPGGYVGAAFAVRGMLVWGFTAGLLAAVLRLGGWALPWDEQRIEDLPDEVIALAARSAPIGPAGRRPVLGSDPAPGPGRTR